MTTEIRGTELGISTIDGTTYSIYGYKTHFCKILANKFCGFVKASVLRKQKLLSLPNSTGKRTVIYPFN